MSVITAISVQEKKKERCNIYVDGEFFAGVPAETVYSLRLKAGQETDAEKLKEILEIAEKTDAVGKAADYVSKAIKTKRQVKDYLIKKGYSETAAYHAVDKLKEYGYISDKDYSSRFIDSTHKTQGRKLIEYKLMMKGVKKEDIGSAYEDKEYTGKEDAARLAEKHIRRKERTKENVAKTYRYLIGKGFSYEEAECAVKLLRGDDEQED